MKKIKSIVKIFLPIALINFISFIRNKGNVSLYEKIAADANRPVEMVDGYFTKFDSPETKAMFEKVTDTIKDSVSDGKVILDVGCGTGRYLKFLRDTFNNVKLYGVDASCPTIMNYTKKLTGIKSAQWDLSNAKNPFDEVIFDLVISITVLQYITVFRVNSFIQTIYKLIKPGGFFFLHFPSSDNSSFFWPILNLNYTKYPPHIRFLRPEKVWF